MEPHFGVVMPDYLFGDPFNTGDVILVRREECVDNNTNWGSEEGEEYIVIMLLQGGGVRADNGRICIYIPPEDLVEEKVRRCFKHFNLNEAQVLSAIGRQLFDLLRLSIWPRILIWQLTQALPGKES